MKFKNKTKRQYRESGRVGTTMRRDSRGGSKAVFAEERRERVIIGKTPKDDTAAVMAAYELPVAFPDKVLEAADRAVAYMNEPGKRLDLRKTFIFTCDPQSARDYDDALSIGEDAKGNRVLGVHIADVSHFVRAGSVLDKEAYKRSTSVYLADKVVPMLPERLSNGVCSLVPNEDRLAFSVFMTFDDKGRMIARKFAKSVIRSQARFTYEQVFSILKQGGKVSGIKVKAPWKAAIRRIAKLASQLREARFAKGALDMEVPELEVVLNDEKEMVGLQARVNDESHQMVEECMVAANEAVAMELWTRGIRILARLHESPLPEKIDELRSGLAAYGIKAGDLSQQKVLARVLKKIKEHPLANELTVMVLRSMKRALYSSESIGHFGLAKEYYAHFTSPIRRYPDLTLHRQLASYLAGYGGREDKGFLARAAKHCSEKEQLADEAERALMEAKKYRYAEEILKSTPGLQLEAVVGKCVKFGLFVDIPSLAISGLVHVSDLAHAYVRWDPIREELQLRNITWKVGTRMKVCVKTVDYSKRRIDFVPAEVK